MRGRFALVLGALLVSAPLYAADLQVTPTHFHFAPGDQSQLLWLINSGSQPLQAQVRLFAWTQNEDDDVLEPSQDFALSPAMISVAPGQRQLVRIIRRAGPVQEGSDAEAAYRLLVDELPVSENSAQPGVNFVFRYSLPLFVMHAEKAPAPQLGWTLRPAAEGVILRVRNDGRRHAQIADLSLAGSAGETTIKQGLFGYVLAGQTREWPLDINHQALGDVDKIRAKLNGERIEHPLSARPPAD